MAGDIPVEKLPDVVLGRDRSYDRTPAMAQLAASNHPEREALLAQVLADSGEQRRYRAVAAITLGRIFTATAERLLMRNLAAGHPVLSDVLKSAGRVGGREALAAIESLQLPEDHPAHGAAVFGAALISYRHRFAGHDLSPPPETELLQPPGADTRRTIEVTKMDSDAAAVVIGSLNRYPYGIEFDSAAATRTFCDGEVNVICINREFVPSGALASTAERKALLAVGALQSPETGEFSPSYLVLTRPRGASGAVELVVTRCSGAYALAGASRLAGDRLEFQLRSVTRPGARAIFIRGALADGVVLAAEAVSSATRVPSKRPLHVVVDRTSV